MAKKWEGFLNIYRGIQCISLCHLCVVLSLIDRRYLLGTILTRILLKLKNLNLFSKLSYGTIDCDEQRLFLIQFFFTISADYFSLPRLPK